MRALLALGLMAGAGCSGDDEGASGDSNPFGNPTAGNNGGAGISGAGAASGASGASGAGIGGTAVCKHVDLVIAVDGSSSMTEELQALRDQVFPAFAQRLRTLGADLDDFRVATLDACPTPANFHTRGNGGECNFSSGQVWIESSSSAIEQEFACVGDIFLGDQQCSGDNDDEQAATSVVAALQDGANAGFQRSDALLIVMTITDEDEQPTGGASEPDDIYRNLTALVNGDPRRMVFVGVGGASECQGAYGDAEEAEDLKQLTGLFEAHDRGVFWDLCQGRLEDGLDEAFRVIEGACDDLCDDLDEDCGGDPPPPGEPTFCEMFPSDPICTPD